MLPRRTLQKSSRVLLQSAQNKHLTIEITHFTCRRLTERLSKPRLPTATDGLGSALNDLCSAAPKGSPPGSHHVRKKKTLPQSAATRNCRISETHTSRPRCLRKRPSSLLRWKHLAERKRRRGRGTNRPLQIARGKCSIHMRMCSMLLYRTARHS